MGSLCSGALHRAGRDLLRAALQSPLFLLNPPSSPLAQASDLITRDPKAFLLNPLPLLISHALTPTYYCPCNCLNNGDRCCLPKDPMDVATYVPLATGRGVFLLQVFLEMQDRREQGG